jgi:molybdopterin/thiamine biosynthesis adenylyltransferase/rhodanese-related sulfurtransferase
MNDDPRKERRETEISIDEAHLLLKTPDAALLMDVREDWETIRGVLEGSVHIPLGELEKKRELLPDKPDKPIIVYCAIGMRSGAAVTKLAAMGYRNVHSMSGGISAWIAAGLPVVNEAGFFSQDEYERYSRHIILKGMGEEGQRRLSKARIVVVGAGGLGCPALLYLAACGVGTIGIVDFDKVELSNLNRQVLHATEDVGKFKVQSAEETIKKINPHLRIIPFNQHLDAGNVYGIIEGFDIVVDGTDNIKTKFLLNDACFFTGKPYIFGGAVSFDGQSGVFHPKSGGPCLRCMFPEPPPEHLVPT